MQKLADIIGPGYPVSVIDVQHQEELEGWTLGDLVEYFEDEERLSLVRKHQQAIAPSNRRKRKNAKYHIFTQGFESNLVGVLRYAIGGTREAAQQFVRDLDWIDHAWISEDPRPQTQYYCLTSTAGCYTDFHVDFGGTLYWPHVVTGAKHFLLLPPTQENLGYTKTGSVVQTILIFFD
jgi:hypothetical protein